MIFIGYINDKTLGNLAHFIDENNNTVFAKVIIKDNIEIYKELSNEEKQILISNIDEDIL